MLLKLKIKVEREIERSIAAARPDDYRSLFVSLIQ